MIASDGTDLPQPPQQISKKPNNLQLYCTTKAYPSKTQVHTQVVISTAKLLISPNRRYYLRTHLVEYNICSRLCVCHFECRSWGSCQARMLIHLTNNFAGPPAEGMLDNMVLNPCQSSAFPGASKNSPADPQDHIANPLGNV